MSAAIPPACDAGNAAHSAAQAVRHPNWILAATILASSLAFIDGSVINVGLAAIGASLKAGAGDLSWVINAYLLPLGALLLLGGAAGDRYGRMRLLVAGTLLFGLASIACALAPSLTLLLAGRAAQGIGAAMLLPNSLAILGASFSGPARGQAVGIWAAMGSVMGAAGPVLGGWLIDSWSWRAIFLINLPLVAGAALLALLFVRDTQERDAPALDWPGGALATAGLGAITWGLTIGTGPGGWTGLAMLLAGAGAFLTLGFLAVERARGEQAMMPLGLFGSASFVGLTIYTWLLWGALGALISLVPYLLIEAGGYSGTGAGAALMPFALLLTVGSPVMGRVAGRMGPRLPLTIGALVTAGGFLLLRTGETTDYWTGVFPGILVIAIGMSGAVAPLTAAVLSSVDDAHTGSASGLNSAVARVAGMVAVALLGGVLGASGPVLKHGFDAAMIACAAAALAGAACAFFLIRVGQANSR
ncbi:MAG: MFS transporter [Alphaproteobacteria bacterium]|nr:MFS transporter [Alphaproteobacteria bacterium]